jgi:outer membrane protein OmpA-like peptidoglycan-associated protein
MSPLETFQSDAVERPLIRRRLFLALVISLLIHAGIIYWFRQTHLPQFNAAPVERLVPRIFSVKTITIDEKLLDGADQQAPPKKVEAKPALKPLDVPDDQPIPNVTEGRMAPVAPSAVDQPKPIATEKPAIQPDETQEIARVQDSAKLALEQDLNGIRDSILKDQPENVSKPGIVLPPANSRDAAKYDAAGMAAASGRLDKLLSHGLHAGDAPVTMPGGALFEFDSSELRSASLDQLRLLGMLIKRSPNVTFYIEGYTDSFGDASYNQQLSQARADSVRMWLIQNMDIDPGHIQSVGYGATRFLVPPQPVDMRSQASIDGEKLREQSNRRVEIKFKFPSKTE